MKASIIVSVFTLVATSAAAPLEKRDQAVALLHCANTGANANACADVVTTIGNAGGWDDSVNGVNDFLDTASQLSGQALTDKLNAALTFANKEPGFLDSLAGTAGLSGNGPGAVSFLRATFPGVPQNLQDAISGKITAQTAVNNINDLRCTRGILQAIGDLWIASAAAVQADTPGRPLGPSFCPLNNGNTGDAYTNDN
jgi:hypothetical protein